MACKRAAPSRVHRAAIVMGKARHGRYRGKQRVINMSAVYLGRQNCGRKRS